MSTSVSGLAATRVISRRLRIAEAPRVGRGVFAERDYEAGEVIESSPVIVIPASDWEHLEKTELFNYCYAWGERLDQMAIALGYGSLYNHSYAPNARYLRRCDDRLIDFVALRPIRRGEEVTINYNGAANCRDPLWFPVAE